MFIGNSLEMSPCSHKGNIYNQNPHGYLILLIYFPLVVALATEVWAFPKIKNQLWIEVPRGQFKNSLPFPMCRPVFQLLATIAEHWPNSALTQLWLLSISQPQEGQVLGKRSEDLLLPTLSGVSLKGPVVWVEGSESIICKPHDVSKLRYSRFLLVIQTCSLEVVWEMDGIVSSQKRNEAWDSFKS